MIKAKAIVPNQYWILREQDRKIGNIQADNSGFAVRINNSIAHFKTLDMLKERMPVAFEPALPPVIQPKSKNVHGYPTTHHPFNGIWDVKRQIPMWTKDERSKSWFAAGWYSVKQHSRPRITLCPKVILLDRYQFQGPFQTRQEAEQA